MVVDSLVMAAGVTVASIVAFGDNVPIRSRQGQHSDGADSRRVNLSDVIMIALFAVAGAFAFNVLAHAG